MNDKNTPKANGGPDGVSFSASPGSEPEPPESHMDECNVICPYCRHEYQAEGEDYTDNEVEAECDECGKSFLRWTEFSVTHHTRPIPQNVEPRHPAKQPGVEFLKAALMCGHFPLWFEGEFVTDPQIQVTGTDLKVKGQWKIEVKCDFRASDERGQPHPRCTGNLFLQVAECNPLRHF